MKKEYELYELAVVVYLAVIVLWLNFAIDWMISWKGEERGR